MTTSSRSSSDRARRSTPRVCARPGTSIARLPLEEGVARHYRALERARAILTDPPATPTAAGTDPFGTIRWWWAQLPDDATKLRALHAMNDAVTALLDRRAPAQAAGRVAPWSRRGPGGRVVAFARPVPLRQAGDVPPDVPAS